MSDALSQLATHFFQVAYVVPDLGDAEAWFERVWGVPRFFRMENVTFGPGCTYRGRPANSSIHLSLGYARETQIELIQSVRGPSIYTEFLESKGPGLHHVAFVVPDFDATVARLRGQGLEAIAEGSLSTGMRVDFAYFDCGTHGASVIEILGFDETARAFMEALRRGEV